MLKTQLQPQSPDTWSTLGPPDADSCSTSGQKTQAFPVTTQVCLTTPCSPPQNSASLGGGGEQESTEWLSAIRSSQTTFSKNCEKQGSEEVTSAFRLLGKVLTWKNPPGTERVRKRKDASNRRSTRGWGIRVRKQACLGGTYFLG